MDSIWGALQVRPSPSFLHSKIWDVLILIKTEPAECRASLESGLPSPPDTWSASGKATLQLHKSWSKACFAFLRLFWVAGSFQGKKKKSPLPFPCRSPGSAEAAGWSQGGITSLEHPRGFAAFPVDPADKSRIGRTRGQGEAATPRVFPLPSLLLSSCISPSLLGPRALFWPSQVVTKA